MVVDALGRDIDSGKLLRGDGGKLCRGCCGGTPGDDCSYCSGDTPAKIRLNFSGVTMNNGCLSGTQYEYLNWPFTINQAFELSQGPGDYCTPMVGNACHWSKTMSLETPFEANSYHDADCGGAQITRNLSNNFFLCVDKFNSGSIRILAMFSSITGHQVFYYSGSPTIVQGTCLGTTVSSLIPYSPYIYYHFAGTGGSVIITEL